MTQFMYMSIISYITNIYTKYIQNICILVCCCKAIKAKHAENSMKFFNASHKPFETLSDRQSTDTQKEREGGRNRKERHGTTYYYGRHLPLS